MWHFFQEHFLWFGFAFYGICAYLGYKLLKHEFNKRGIYWNGSPEQQKRRKEFEKIMAESREKRKKEFNKAVDKLAEEVADNLK